MRCEMRVPVSAKGILIRRGRVLLLRNDRGEWELPGGRLDDEETPERALRREFLEETGLRVTVGPLVDAWVFQVTSREKVLVLEYACRKNGNGDVRISREHNDSAWLPVGGLNREPLPRGYLRGIRRALAPSRSRTSR
jgi:8-oxo-dGTP pyrophosphatase MutT (NUDIX family)